jgi:hypothetical protein
MTIKKATLTVAAVVLATGVAGCWDSTEVTVHSPGEYKGEQDPLLAQSASARTETLMKRFQLVQVDR